MNTNDITENEILSFRFRSKRQKKRAQRVDFEKKLIALDKEEGQLSKQLRSLGWVDLKPPVMRGWKRYFVLREDVQRSKNASLFANILNKINTVQYSSRKDFKVKKRKSGRKIYVPKEQQLLRPDEYQFKKLGFTEAEKQLFEERIKRYPGIKEPAKIYVFREPWRFVLRIRPNLVSKTRARDVAIEKRVREIDRFLERNGLKGKLYRLLYGNDKRKWRKGKEEWKKNPLKNKPLPQLLDELKYYEEEFKEDKDLP